MSAKTIKNPNEAASPQQIGFINKLQQERGLPAGMNPGLTKGQASEMIDALMAMPKAGEAPQLQELPTGAQAAPAPAALSIDKPEAALLLSWAGCYEMETGQLEGVEAALADKLRSFLHAKPVALTAAPAPKDQPKTASDWATVPEGRYAVTGQDGTLDFYVVELGKPGSKWAGFTFLSLQVSDDYKAVKVPAVKKAVLAKIAADPKAAAIAYGKAIGKCGVCNKTLTDPDSIAAGIGPVCAKNQGW